jgi:hypothetical protein
MLRLIVKEPAFDWTDRMGGFKPNPGSFYADLLAKIEAAFALADVQGKGPTPCWNFSKDLSTRCFFFGKAIDGETVSIRL